MNTGPADYKSAALPTKPLRRHMILSVDRKKDGARLPQFFSLLRKFHSQNSERNPLRDIFFGFPLENFPDSRDCRFYVTRTFSGVSYPECPPVHTHEQSALVSLLNRAISGHGLGARLLIRGWNTRFPDSGCRFLLNCGQTVPRKGQSGAEMDPDGR